MLAEAKIDFRELAAKNEADFMDDMKMLGVLPPHALTRVSCRRHLAVVVVASWPGPAAWSDRSLTAALPVCGSRSASTSPR